MTTPTIAVMRIQTSTPGQGVQGAVRKIASARAAVAAETTPDVAAAISAAGLRLQGRSDDHRQRGSDRQQGEAVHTLDYA